MNEEALAKFEEIVKTNTQLREQIAVLQDEKWEMLHKIEQLEIQNKALEDKLNDLRNKRK